MVAERFTNGPPSGGGGEPPNRNPDWGGKDSEPPGGWSVHFAEWYLMWLAWLLDWVAPLFLGMVLGSAGGDLALLYIVGNSAIYQGMTGGASVGKQIAGIRLCYVSSRYDDWAAFYCEVTVMRSCVRFVCHIFDLMLFPYALFLRPLARVDRRTLSDSITRCKLVRDRRIHVFSISEMREERRLKGH